MGSLSGTRWKHEKCPAFSCRYVSQSNAHWYLCPVAVLRFPASLVTSKSQHNVCSILLNQKLCGGRVDQRQNNYSTWFIFFVLICFTSLRACSSFYHPRRIMRPSFPTSFHGKTRAKHVPLELSQQHRALDPIGSHWIHLEYHDWMAWLDASQAIFWSCECQW